MRKYCMTLAVMGLLLVGAAMGDEITFSVVGLSNVADIFSSPSGMTAGPASVVLVTDVTQGKSFSLSETFNASAGAAHSITVGSTVYTAFYGPGAVGSVDITNAVAGNMLDNSELTAVFPQGTGSFSGEFLVTSVNPAVLALFGLGPKFNPSGSVAITFGQDQVNGQDLSGVIGGGATTILTVNTTPELMTILLFGTGIVMAGAMARRNWQG